MTERSGFANTPPLKLPIGAVMPSDASNTRNPRGGRLLIMEKQNPACSQVCHPSLSARRQNFVVGHQCAVDIRDKRRDFRWPNSGQRFHDGFPDSSPLIGRQRRPLRINAASASLGRHFPPDRLTVPPSGPQPRRRAPAARCARSAPPYRRA